MSFHQFPLFGVFVLYSISNYDNENDDTKENIIAFYIMFCVMITKYSIYRFFRIRHDAMGDINLYLFQFV